MNGNRLISIIFMILSAVLYAASFSYPDESTIYVRFILTIFFVLSAVLFFAKPRNLKPIKNMFNNKKVMALLLIIAYVILIPIAGFFISTFVFLIAFMYSYNRVGIIKYSIISLVFCLIIYAAFYKWLSIWFPTGFLM